MYLTGRSILWAKVILIINFYRMDYALSIIAIHIKGVII